MIINGAGHWGWLIHTLVTEFPQVCKNYNFLTTLEGLLLTRKLFQNNVEIIIIKRTSSKCYKIALYYCGIIDFTSCRTAIAVGHYLNCRCIENKFLNQK